MATPRLPTPPGPVPVSFATEGEDPVIPREIGGDAAEVLGNLLECVSTWVARTVEGRGLGYHPAADHVRPDAVPELLLTVEALLRLVYEDRPDPDTSEAVGLGCFQIAEWAEERGALGTALAWAQAAIAAWPQQPHYAYLIGRLARKRAQNAHAEEWLRYAMRLARQRMVWEVYTLSLSGYANLKRQKGNYPAATRYHRLALKAAQRRGLRTLEGDALYDLAVISINAGDVRAAIQYGREALRAYGSGHLRVLRLAHDFAWLLMNNYGEFFHAANILQNLTASIWEPAYRLILLANLCRASAGAGWDAVFEKAWIEGWTLITTSPSREGHAPALLQMAMGAASVGAWERVEIAAERALMIARDRREGSEILMAEAMLNALAGDRSEEEKMFDAFPDLRRLQEVSRDQPFERADDLVTEVVLALRARRDGAPESPVRALSRITTV
jgi:tetratricopeptide (TPR) repeat protein